ncbi:MAG TPA: hypothetical protein VGC49_13540 [Solirubrobacterales bacterium]|jgi:uncharacterized protein involved in exopolysaccharide biosynthesis
MQPARTLKILWRRWRLVLLGGAVALLAALLAVYRVDLAPPSLESRTNVFATASTQILVDTPSSAFADLSNELDPLETRASVFARFLTSPAAIALIAREANLPATAIEARGPYELNLPPQQQEPTAEQRSSQILGEGALYRMRFENNPDLPVVSVYAQAPTKEAAIALAAAAPSALRDYVERIQDEQHTPAGRRVEIRTLGAATGGVVNGGVDRQIAALVFVVVFAAWCMLLVPAQTIAQGWREPDGRNGPPGGPGEGNGRGRQEDVARPGREGRQVR